MMNMRWNTVRTPRCEGEKMFFRKELIEGRGREGDVIEVDNKINPLIGCRRVKRCWIWGETVWGHPSVREKWSLEKSS
jgi:hypothetical protein